MTINNKISIQDYTYFLPDERIARYPLPERSASKLLVYKDGQIDRTVFTNLPDILPDKSFLMFNNTRVIQARLLFYKETGACIEIFCLEPFEPDDFYQAFQVKLSCKWKCLVGNLKKWKQEKLIIELNIDNKTITMSANLTGNFKTFQIIEFSWNEADFSFGELLEKAGKIPIPPYLKRDAEDLDKDRYQTVYSKTKGSVAAPTAGLHFTPEVFTNLEKKGFAWDEITLHVGAGTFQPVKSEYISDHEMHTEHFFIQAQVIRNILSHQDQIVAVGTTTVRTLESLYWLGVKVLEKKITDIPSLKIDQWECYQLPNQHSLTDSLSALFDFVTKKGFDFLEASTQIMIIPGYKFRIVNSLITNFHQPQSSLLLLIAAFVGEDWKKIYEYALENDFRFLSYGDSSYLKGKDF